MEITRTPLSMDVLPQGYAQTAEFNLKNNTQMMILLNVAGFVLFMAATILLPIYINLVRPLSTSVSFSFQVDNLSQIVVFLLILLLDVVILVILHEGIHGLCFRLITGRSPRFAIGPGYAYAAAPDVFIRQKPYLVVGLSPLIGLTIAGLIIIPFIDPSILFHVSLILVMNIAGAVGDLWIVQGVLRKKEPLLVKDEGDRVVIYQPVES